ncbi:MAG: DUF4838 domain-containing protein [Lentisphaerae bacterium]|nr:DUF4838 domain-containing protein [Lentisphaerota bacterium]
MRKSCVILSLLLIMVMTAWGNTDTPSGKSDNLVSDEYFKQQLSWVNPALLWACYTFPRTVEVRDEVFVMTSQNGSIQASIPLNIGYETANRFRLTFEYQLIGNGRVSANHLSSVKRLTGSPSFPLKQTKQWTTFDQTFNRVPESDVINLVFSLTAKGSQLKLKNLCLSGIEPADSAEIPVVLAGKEAEGIYFRKGDFHAMYSAKLFHSQLWRVKNVVLPLKECSVDELKTIRNGIIFTTYSEKKSFFSKWRSADIGPGGYELTITPGKAVIRGNDKISGLELGAVDLLRRLGIDYVTIYIYTNPKELKAAACDVCISPAVAMRFTPWQQQMPELLGYSNPVLMQNGRKLGASRGFGHSTPFFLPYSEFGKSHPEYYALQEDGKRLHPKPGQRNFQAHFCMSNREAQRIIAERMIEYIKSEPLAKYFPVFPGDGGNMYCRCDECMNMGKNLGERTIAWVNAVARRVVKVCPGTVFSAYAYVDSRFPPETVFPDKNVIIQYCPYGPVWMNHLINDHPDNAQGIADLKEWERKCPGQIALYDYPAFCRERLNIWPAFYANYERFKHAAEKKYPFLEYCNLSSTYGSGNIPASSFADLSLYVFSKVLIDPKTDVEKEIDSFMKLYYGPAAQFMRAYFDLAHKEVRDRQWSQNTERIIRGFVTKPFAAKCYDFFAKAEKATEDTVYYDRVREHKLHLLWSDLTDNCRGNGKISSKELPQYAEKLAEFCRICKQYGKSYNKIPYKKWFWDTAVLHIDGKGAFYNDPLIVKLMDDPLNTLLKTVPDAQKKTDYGYFIGNAGLMGGERMKSSWLTANPMWVTCLRRPSSGFGVAQFILKLDENPQHAELELYGIDNEKKSQGLMKIEVNGVKIFEGKVPWGKDDWSACQFPIPANLLHKGENDVAIFNVTPDTEVDGEGGVNFLAKRNYFWGWFMIRDVKILLK